MSHTSVHGVLVLRTGHRNPTRLCIVLFKLSDVERSFTWWRHQMETFSALPALCAGNSPVTGEFPSQRPVTQSFGVSFDLRLNKRLSKQSRGWRFETPSRSLSHHCNECLISEGLHPASTRIVNMNIEYEYCYQNEPQNSNVSSSSEGIFPISYHQKPHGLYHGFMV